MPYEVKHTMPRLVAASREKCAAMVVVSRRAVGTLKEARDHAVELCRAAGPDLMAPLAASFTPEPGGVIDLPDGGRIEVRFVEWADLAVEAGFSGTLRQVLERTDAALESTRVTVLAAFNAENDRGKSNA